MATIEFNGTGGLMEGDFGTNNINVNLDDVLHFDGTDDKIDTNITLSTTFDGAFTVSAWVKLDDGQGTGRRILGSRNSASEDWVQLMLESSGQVSLYYESNNNSTEAMTNSVIFPNGETPWVHIAATVPTSGNIIIYINGVAQSLDGTKDGDMSGITVGDFSTTTDLFIGCRNTNGTPEGFFQGYIADVRLQDSALTAAEIGVLASKINVDYTLVNSTQPTGWYKLTNNSTANSGSGGGTPTVTGTTRHYDAFSVNVQDNSTTTDGTFTVTQGKLEGLSLTCLDFEAGDSADRVEVTHDTSGFSSVSVSAWVNFESVGNWRGIIQCSDDAGWNDGFGLTLNGSSKLGFWIDNDSDRAELTASDTAALVGKWAHIVGTFDSTTGLQSLYIDGVLKDTNSDTWSNKAASGSKIKIGCGVIAGNGNGYWHDGKIRDVRINNYTLSADQVASLYSGNYNVTPYLGYKLDEGSGNASGWGTANAGGASGGTINGAVFSNGTLDLNSPSTDQLRITANGTLSAPRGNLAIGGAIGATVNAFENYGTFIHNNGTVTFDATADYGQRIQETASAATAFYNLTHNRSGSSYHLYIKGDITVENILLNQSGFVNLYGPNTLTMGTTTSAGAITMTSSGLRFYDNTSSAYAKVYGASELYPFVYTGYEPDIDSYSTNASHVALKNGDIQVDMTSDYQGGIVRLDGDMIFDAVTVSGGDTLDINGQRMECSGDFVQYGTINMGGAGAMLIAATYNLDSTIDEEDGATIVISGGSDGSNNDLGHSSFVGNDSTTIFVNNGSTSVDWNSSSHYAGSMILGSSFRCQNATDCKTGNLTVATGSTLDADNDTITVAGDFTTSGGLIGKSAADFITDDGATNGNYITCGNANNSDGWTNISVEGWVKLDHLGRQGAETTFFARGGSNNPKFGVYDGKLRMYGGNADRSFGGTGSNGDVANQTALVIDKWYHVALSFNNSTGVGKMYLDGKLDCQATIESGWMPSDVAISTIGCQGAGNRHMDGVMAKISIWNHELTQAEIRQMMFYDWNTLDNDSDFDSIKSDCKFFYQFDEGAGDAVDDAGDGGNNGTWQTRGSQGAAWVGAGTFDGSDADCKITMTGAGKSLNYLSGEVLGQLLIDNSSGTVTASALTGTNNLTVYSLKVNDSSASFTAPSGTLTITGKNSANYHIDIDGVFVHSSGTVKIDTSLTGDKLLDIIPSSGTGLNNLIINEDGSGGVQYNGNSTIAGDLTIEEGIMTGYDYNNSELTVTGDVTIENGGTLGITNQTGACSFGSLTIESGGTYVATSGTTTLNGTVDVGMRVDGTFNNNDGTFVIDGSITKVQMGSIGGAPTGFSTNNAPFHNLIINDSINFAWSTGTLFNVEGDLTVAAGQTLGANNENSGIKVLGDVTLNGTLGNSSLTNSCEFGSLTINSGGTYSATSGTTTITTGAATYSSEGSFAIVGGGTFTHNNGTLVLDSVGQRLPKGGTFYNVTLTGSQSTGGLYLYNSVLSPAGIMPDGTTGANYVSILGTLSITDDEFRPYNADKIYIHNLVIGDGTGSANEAKFDMSEADTFDGTVFVDNVTINSDGQLLFGDGDETSSTVGSSALNIYGAFRNIGGSVDIT